MTDARIPNLPPVARLRNNGVPHAMEAPQLPDERVTETPRPALRDDPIWAEALDWLLKTRAAPTDEALQQALANWLGTSPEHARAYRKAERVWLLSGDLSFARPAPCPESPPIAPPRRINRWRRALVAGALAASITLLALPTWQGMTSDEATAVGEHRSLVLEDGSRVELDSDSAIDVHFSNGGRQVTLRRGQAFFQVKPDSQRPFQVRAGEVEVTVTGTAFDVSLAPRQVAVAVDHGSVQVSNGAAGEPLARLTAGDRLRVPEHGAPLLDRVPRDQIAAWRNWRLLVNDRPLSEVVDELRRYQPGLILLQDNALAERRITAALDLRSPQAALQAALAPLGGQVSNWSPLLLVIDRH